MFTVLVSSHCILDEVFDDECISTNTLDWFDEIGLDVHLPWTLTTTISLKKHKQKIEYNVF